MNFKNTLNSIAKHFTVFGAAYLIFGLATAMASFNMYYIPAVQDIATMKAMGIYSASYPNIQVINYANSNDGGGGMFNWKSTSTATADNCITFAATGVATGRWVRQYKGNDFNVDMCGTGTADDSTAFNNAFAACYALRIPLSFSAKRYLLNHNLSVEPTCSFNGAGVYNLASSQPVGTALDFKGDVDGGTCLSIVHSATTLGNYDNGADYGNFSLWGATSGLLADEHCTKGIYLSRVAGAYLHDVQVYYVKGPGIFIGNTILSTLARAVIFTSGIAGGGMLEIDGETSGGTEYFGTTLLVTEADVGASAPNIPQAGIMIDRYTNVTMLNGTSENNGIPLDLEAKASSTQGLSNIVIENMDFETPGANGAGATVCIRGGQGWSGTTSRAIIELTVMNISCIGNSATITSQIIMKQSTDFYGFNNQFEAGNASAVDYDFQGTGNVHENVFLAFTQGTTPIYVKVNGTTVADAQSFLPWSVDGEPVTVANLPTCNTTNNQRHMSVTNATQTLTAGIGAAVAGGGANAVPVYCDGTSWKIG